MKNINSILKLNIPFTQIVSAKEEVYSDNCFYRINCETSFAEGSFIRTEVCLPENWNGIYLGCGNGGMAGGLSSDYLRDRACEGYAAAHTDMGTFKGRDFGIKNREVWKDFGWRSTHNMTVIAKALIVECYGKTPDYSYFYGGSTGGQQALAMAQRFPEDFDGIIADKPANNRVFLHTYFLWNHVHLTTADGSPLFTYDEVRSISKIAPRFFQNLDDGENGDDFITFPKNDSKTIQAFLEFLSANMPDLSATQLSALKAVYMGPVNPRTHKQIYNGMPIGSEVYPCGIMDCQGSEPPHYYPFNWVFGADYKARQFDFDKDLETVSDALSGDLNANCADLSAFKEKGGKLIMLAGTADPCVPFPDNAVYFKRLYDNYGDEFSTFFRFFLFPGRDHCGQGEGLNATICDSHNIDPNFYALRKWCEEGIAPEYLMGAHIENGDIKFTRKIYPYSSKENTVDKYCEEYYYNK